MPIIIGNFFMSRKYIMKRVVLVNPPLTLKERYFSLNQSGSTFPNLGLMYLGAMAKNENCNVMVVDAPSLGLDIEDCIKLITEFNPALVGITSVTQSIPYAAEIAKSIKRFNENILTIIGGAHVTAIPEDTLGKILDFDLGVIGEGEITFQRIIQNINNSSELYKQDGIAYRYNNKVVLNPPRKPINNLDDLPFPAWELIPDFPDRYKPAAYKFKHLPATYLVNSRGCPYKCNFCDTSVYGKKRRYYSNEFILKMMRHLIEKYGIKEFVFEDDLFCVNKKRVLEFCELIKKEDFKITFSCNVRAELVDQETLSALKEIGCWMISVGIESSDENILQLVDKNIKMENVIKTIKTAKKVGMNTKGFFIIGLPGENENTINNTIKFAKEIGLSNVSVSKMTPFPGTEIYNNSHKYGTFENSWGEMNLMNPVFVPHGMTQDLLEYYHKKFLKEFYLRPGIIFHYFKKAISNPVLFKTYLVSFFGLLRMIFNKSK